MKNLRSVLKESMDVFVRHPFFTSLKSETISSDKLKVFSSQYWHLSGGFPAVLGLAVSRLSTDKARWPVVKNLWDEHGGNQADHGHRIMYRDFLKSVAEEIEINPVELTGTPIAAHTSVYLAGMKHLILSSSESRISGHLAFCEAVAPFQCKAIGESLEKLNPVRFSKDSEGARFWTDHAEHDAVHIREILSICDAIDGFEISEFSLGVSEALILECVFWDGVVSTSSVETK